MENSVHLTPKQLANRWHLSEKTLERWRCQGTGPHFLKLGNRVLYPLEQIEVTEAQSLRQTYTTVISAANHLCMATLSRGQA